MPNLVAMASIITELSPAELSGVARNEGFLDLLAQLRKLPYNPTVEAAIYRLESRLYLAAPLQPTVH